MSTLRTLTVQAVDLDTNQPLAVTVYTWIGLNTDVQTTTTSFSRQFAATVEAKLACLPTAGGKMFRYMRSGTDVRYEANWSLSMASDRQVTIAYGSGATGQRVLRELAINGDASLAENTSRTYTATATFTDNSTATVQPQSWSLTQAGAPASISGGVLDAGAVSADTIITVRAAYTEGSVTANATKSVTILNGGGSTYALNLVVNGQGEITRTPNINQFSAGATVVLRAVPVAGYRFTGWGGDASGTTTEITLTMNAAKSVSATFVSDPNYFPAVRVVIQPAGAVAAGALWRLDLGPWQASGTSVRPDSNGDHNIFFSDIGGYTAPAFKPVKIVSGQSLDVTASYVSLLGPGSLQVVLQPAAAVAVGAQWRPTGGDYAWQNSGATLAGLAGGVYQIEFKTVAGWSVPAARTVTVNDGSASTDAATYGPPAGTPALYSVLPANGPLAGGTVVTLDGANLTPPVAVFFDGVAATSVNPIDATRVTAVAPARASGGTVAVKVTAAGGEATQVSGFTYGPKLGEKMQLEVSLGGTMAAVDVFESRAYVGQGATLVVFDVTNPANPTPLGRLTLPYSLRDIAVYRAADNKLYAAVAASEGGLMLVDVTTPAAMLLKGSLQTGGYARDVALLGGLAYLADSNSGLAIIDLANPAKPTLRGTATGVGYASNVMLEIGADSLIAYLADASGNRIHFLDVSVPETPVSKGAFVHGYGWSDGIYGLGKKNNTLYVALPQAVIVVNVTDLANPVLVRNLAGQANSGTGVFVQGNTLYSVRRDVGADIFDISNPTAPSRLVNFVPSSVNGWAQRSAMRNNYLYLAGTDSGLSIVNVSNPSSPSLTANVRQGTESARSVRSTGPQAVVFAGNSNRGVNVYSVDTLSTARYLTKMDTGDGGISGFAQNGNLLFASGGDNGIYVMDVTTPSQPTIRGRFTPISAFGNIGLHSGRPVVAGYKTDFSGNAGFWIADVSNPGSPTTYGTTGAVGGVRHVAVNGNRAYVSAGESAGLRIFDLTDARNPREIGSLDTPGYALSVAVSADGQAAYVAEGYTGGSMPGGVLIVDVSNPQAPVAVGSLLGGKFTGHVSVSGQRLVVSRSSDGVTVFDLANPRSPLEVAGFNTPGSAYEAMIDGDRVYVADGDQGVAVLTLLDAVAPTITITNPTFSSTYTSSTATLALGGSASDDKALARVVWSNDRGGAGEATGLESWTVSGIALAPGSNVIRVSAIDATGNLGSDTLTVTYLPPDAVAPTISIATPTLAETTVSGAATLALGGIANDNLGIAAVTWSNDRGGAGTATGTTNWTVAAIPLVEGPNLITVTAHDISGNVATDVLTVFYVPPDTVAPVVTILFPTLDTTLLTTEAQLNLSGTASDNRSVKRVVWSNSRGGGGAAVGTNVWSANGIALHAGLNVLTVTAEDEGGLSSSDTLLVTFAPSIELTISRQPEGQAVAAGDVLTMSVAASGQAPLSYQWRKDGVVILGATASSYSVSSAGSVNKGNYSVVVGNSTGSIVSSIARVTVVPAGTVAAHALVGVDYVPGETVTLTNSLAFTAPLGNVAWQVLLPPNWSLASDTAALASTRPQVGMTEFIEWVWTTPATSPLTFSYTLNVPAGFTAKAEVVASVVINSETDLGRLVARPDPLFISRRRHSADSDGDFRISFFELTRVIELYNCRRGTERVGRYQLATSSTEDGFISDPTATSDHVLTIYHSADTNKNSRIELFELTRVIALYNQRNGNLRTGQFHARSGTEDGFAPGP